MLLGVMCVIRDLFLNGILLKEVNATVISLVPKVATPCKVSEYRPIACCNVIYKIISKVICNRIEGSLNDLVDVNQSAFIPSRQIIDNILLSQELMRNYHRSRAHAKCAFKIDIEKAYDSVEWDFLANCLKFFGLHDTLVKWGDPLSPYLFTLIMEVLNLVLRREIKNNPSFRYHWLCKEVKLTHLCFTDDLLLFCNGDSKSVSVMKKAHS
nr:RNA-directed DNA polymerase, eukaryota, reverse transcriptase zinc-binding domain protein [Tanacetum cinerariifolium]